MDRVTSVLGPGTVFNGRLSGSGGVRIEGSFEGEISLDGLLVIGENGKVASENLTATTVVIAGVVKGNITAEKVEIRSTGRVWGDLTTGAFATQEGAFLRGQVRMEEQIELEFIEEAGELAFEEAELEPEAPDETAEEAPSPEVETAATTPDDDAPADSVEEGEPAGETGDLVEETADPPEEKPKRGRKRSPSKKTAAE